MKEVGSDGEEKFPFPAFAGKSFGNKTSWLTKLSFSLWIAYNLMNDFQ